VTLQEEMVLLWTMIRTAWTRYSPNRREVLNDCAVKVPKLKKDGTPSKVMIWKWKCAHCGELVESDQRQVDHIEAVGALPRTEVDLPNLVQRLFTNTSNLQVLCKGCHRLKSAKEATERAARKPKRS